MIKTFTGEFRWLSNFVGGVEQKYQAAKCIDPKDAEIILALSPGAAKRKGRVVPIRSDWERVKLDVMKYFVLKKFSQEPYKTLLLNTGNQEIQEGNYWHDTFWGVDELTKKGQNHLGKIIMQVREELRNEQN